MNRRKISGMIILSQTFYHSAYCLMIYFASVFLLDRGFSNGRIGTVMGLAFALSIPVQQAVPMIIARYNIRMCRLLGGLYILISGASFLLYLLPLNDPAAAAMMIGIFCLQIGLAASVDSLYRGYELQGISLSFGLFRGIGSGMFALASLVMGMMLKIVPPATLPLFYGVITLLLCICLFKMDAPNAIPPRKEASARTHLITRDRWFILFLAGVVCICITSSFIDNFLLQIMLNVGGSSSSMSIALFIVSIIEMPAMMLYPMARKKLDVTALLILSGWFWTIKNLLICISNAPMGVYLSMIFQLASYAVYTIAVVDYLNTHFHKADFLQGQACVLTAKTVGSLAATLIGGHMIDIIGMDISLWIMVVLTVLGALCFTVSVRKHA